MKKIKLMIILTSLVMTFFTGCALEDIEDIEDMEEYISSETDKLTLSKMDKGFLITWTKKSLGYGEVIYTDDSTKERGIGNPLTSNSIGTFYANCIKVEDRNGVGVYSCNPSNISRDDYLKQVIFKSGTQYKWLVSSRLNHTHGNVEAVIEYNDGILTIN